MASSKHRPAQPIMRECDHCGGEGDVQVNCYDCGDELDTDSLADGEEDVCKTCAAQRAEDAAETARQKAAQVS